MAGVSQEENIQAEKLKELGLVAQHSYVLLDKKSFTDAEEKSIEIVKLRNPWGDFKWKGDWSLNSDKWTEEALKEVNDYEYSEEGDKIYNYLVPADDDTFWMAYEEFKQYFTRI